GAAVLLRPVGAGDRGCDGGLRRDGQEPHEPGAGTPARAGPGPGRRGGTADGTRGDAVIAPEQDRLTQLMDELAHRADGTAPADRLDRVHGRARRTTQVRVVVAATAAAVVVVAAGTLITRSGDV